MLIEVLEQNRKQPRIGVKTTAGLSCWTAVFYLSVKDQDHKIKQLDKGPSSLCKKLQVYTCNQQRCMISFSKKRALFQIHLDILSLPHARMFHHCRGDVEAPAPVPNAFVNRTSVLWTYYTNKILVYLYILVHILYICIYVENIPQAKICNTACFNTLEYLKVSPQTFAPNAGSMAPFLHSSIFPPPWVPLAVSVNGFSYRSICSLPRIEFRFSHFAT